MDAFQLKDIAERWEGVDRGFVKLTFEAAKADMTALLAAVREQGALNQRVKAAEAHVAKRNEDVKAFVSEVSRLADQKYADWSKP